MAEAKATAEKLGIAVVALEIRGADDIAPAIEAAAKARSEALYVVNEPLAINHRQRIAALALQARMPTMHDIREHVEAGGLMSYGPNFPDLYRRAASHIDKILRGTKPDDIPVEQPTKLDLIINVKTAKALGVELAADAARPRRRGDRMRRREFIAGTGGAATSWPLAARAQQAMPVIGRGGRIPLGGRPRRSGGGIRSRADAPTGGGRVCGRRRRRGEDRQKRRLVHPGRVRVGGDPVAAGAVASLNRPGGNATGLSNMTAARWPKRLELLRELTPAASELACSSGRAIRAPSRPCGMQAAARPLGEQVQPGRTRRSVNSSAPSLASRSARRRPAGDERGGVFQQPRPDRGAGGATCHSHDLRSARIRAGRRPDELRSSSRDQYRQPGLYVDRILKGEKPADLPVKQPTKYELVINLKTAKALGLTVPPTLLARADEVIE